MKVKILRPIVRMFGLGPAQAEAALELQRLRARLLDGLCPAKLRQSERVKRLAKRLARLERNVGRISAVGKQRHYHTLIAN